MEHPTPAASWVMSSSPLPSAAGTQGYTEDYAIIKADSDKIDRRTFHGNDIDLGTEIPRWDFTEKLSPNTNFEYPIDRLLKLLGTITEEEMRRPGMTTGVTIGPATGVVSFVREYVNGLAAGDYRISKERVIFPYDDKSGSFSAPGGSRSVVVDGCGRVGGLLTGGAGAVDMSELDVSYAMPIDFLMESIRANG
ncbi:hypothetical protein EDD18DRAFT_1402909 [Armillaria luteobubalina]|uniref:Uncharacterized protein n=1 Tax=Armillaria luteobubalina TaxID=153913 RepID=A0AA39URA2_9AGAR|nr:hypothetical protein EDD18DRAFT_1402909 [Armillaria luteobubalina]